MSTVAVDCHNRRTSLVPSQPSERLTQAMPTNWEQLPQRAALAVGEREGERNVDTEPEHIKARAYILSQGQGIARRKKV